MNQEFCGIEKLSLVDYEGKIACTVFTGGCNFLCPFCHNSVLVREADKIERISDEEIFTYLKKRKGIIDAVVVSGGEPTLKSDLIPFLEKVKDLNLLIKLDTNGSAPDKLRNLIDKKLIDYVAMDIKNSKKHYGETIGIRNFDCKNVEESVKILLNGKIDYEFRTTLINEYHSLSDMEEIGEWIKGAKRYFLQKFVDRGSCIKEGLTEVVKEKALIYCNYLARVVQKVELRGY